MKFLSFVIIVTLRIIYQPHAHTDQAPFALPSPLPAVAACSTPPAQFISFNASINSHKVLLQWVVKENETADQFQVEKSLDGEHFTLAALVFGTDKAETTNYSFYEKAAAGKTMYRVKLISKDHQTQYSRVIEIDPKDAPNSEISKPIPNAWFC